MSEWKVASGLSLWSTTVFIDHLKKESLPPWCIPTPTPTSPLPTFQLDPDGWSNAIRSNYSTAEASSLSLPQTLQRHTLLRQEGKTQLCSAAPLSIPSLVSIFPPIQFILFTGLHPPCLPFSGKQPLTVLWHPPTYLPPHPPSHVLLLYICTVSSLFNHIFPPSILLSASETAWLPLLLNNQTYFCLKTCNPADPC